MLTDTHCRNAKPKEKLYRLNDQRGLYREVKPNGVKAWRYRFTLDGKASMFALGEYPAVTLSEARERSEAARKLVKQGINPVQQRQLDRIRQASEAKNTFEIVAKEWLRQRTGKMSPRTGVWICWSVWCSPVSAIFRFANGPLEESERGMAGAMPTQMLAKSTFEIYRLPDVAGFSLAIPAMRRQRVNPVSA